MLVLVRVAVALLATQAAGKRAGFQHGQDAFLVSAGAPYGQRSGRLADVGAIKIQADALAKLGHHVLVEASVGAGRAALGAREAFLDAADQRFVGAAHHGRMASDHLSHVVHGESPLLSRKLNLPQVRWFLPADSQPKASTESITIFATSAGWV
jgi:hypothetical protein